MSKTGTRPDFHQILTNLSTGDLIGIIEDRLKENDPQLEHLILARAPMEIDPRSVNAVVDRLVSQYVNKRYDLVGDSRGLADALYTLYDRAMEALDRDDGCFTVAILTRSIELTAPYFSSSDDEGDLMAVVNSGFDLLHSIAVDPSAKIPALQAIRLWADKNRMVQWALSGDSWDLECLSLFASASRTDDERRGALQACESYKASARGSYPEYTINRCALISIKLLRSSGDRAALNDYIAENLHLHDVRLIAIDEADASQDYERGIALCREGIALGTNARIDVSEFERRLISLLDKSGGAALATRELERQVLRSFSKDRYLELKKRYDDQCSWEQARDGIVAAFEQDATRNSYWLAAIFAEEAMHERLLAVVEKNTFLFEDYLELIGDVFPAKAAAFLKKRIEGELRSASKRSAYTRLARDIQKYGTYAGTKAAETLFDFYLSTYPTRRAMCEEFQQARAQPVAKKAASYSVVNQPLFDE